MGLNEGLHDTSWENEEGDILSIIDGHHRVQKVIRTGLDIIKCKLIPINSLPKEIRRVFKHIN